MITNITSLYLVVIAPKRQLQSEDQKSLNTYEGLLYVTSDKKLSFRQNVEDLCKKASQDPHALSRLSHHIDPIKSEIVLNTGIKAQLNYCLIVRMLHDGKINYSLTSEDRLQSPKAKTTIYGRENSQYIVYPWRSSLQNELKCLAHCLSLSGK